MLKVYKRISPGGAVDHFVATDVQFIGDVKLVEPDQGRLPFDPEKVRGAEYDPTTKSATVVPPDQQDEYLRKLDWIGNELMNRKRPTDENNRVEINGWEWDFTKNNCDKRNEGKLKSLSPIQCEKIDEIVRKLEAGK